MVHDGGKIALELQGNTVTAVYRHSNSLVARNDEVVLGDGLGTVRQTVDGVQAVTSTFTTEAFGNTVSQWGSSSNPYRFAGLWGYRDDGDAGLLHVGARYYDPQVGRFISRDVALSEHPYLYCEHEPVNAVDPSGDTPAAALPGLLVPGVREVTIGVGLVIIVGIGIKKLIDDLEDWQRARERQKEHKKGGREDKAKEKGWKQKVKDGDLRPGEKRPKMKHKQKDAHDY